MRTKSHVDLHMILGKKAVGIGYIRLIVTLHPTAITHVSLIPPAIVVETARRAIGKATGRVAYKIGRPKEASTSCLVIVNRFSTVYASLPLRVSDARSYVKATVILPRTWGAISFEIDRSLACVSLPTGPF